MKISLGTTSDQKKAILENVARKRFPDIEIVACNVVSGIVDQPLSLTETITGSINRAAGAIKMENDCVCAIGMEAGLQKWNDMYYLVCSVAIDDHQDSFIGLSAPVPIPREVSHSVEAGSQFGEEIRKYKQTEKLDKKMESIVEELINRGASFTSALEMALDQLQNKTDFKP